MAPRRRKTGNANKSVEPVVFENVSSTQDVPNVFQDIVNLGDTHFVLIKLYHTIEMLAKYISALKLEISTARDTERKMADMLRSKEIENEVVLKKYEELKQSFVMEWSKNHTERIQKAVFDNCQSQRRIFNQMSEIEKEAKYIQQDQKIAQLQNEIKSLAEANAIITDTLNKLKLTHSSLLTTHDNVQKMCEELRNDLKVAKEEIALLKTPMDVQLTASDGGNDNVLKMEDEDGDSSTEGESRFGWIELVEENFLPGEESYPTDEIQLEENESYVGPDFPTSVFVENDIGTICDNRSHEFISPSSPPKPYQENESTGANDVYLNPNAEMAWELAAKDNVPTGVAVREVCRILRAKEEDIVLNETWDILFKTPERNMAIACWHALGMIPLKKRNIKRGNHVGLEESVSKLVTLIQQLSQRMLRIPNLIYEYFLDVVICNREKKFLREADLIRTGEFFGGLFRAFKTFNGGCQEIIWRFLLFRPPEAASVAFGLIKTFGDDFNEFDFKDKRTHSLRERIAAYCLTHVHPRYKTPACASLSSLANQSLKWNIPFLVYPELFSEVANEMIEMENDKSLQVATEVLSCLCVFYGPECLPQFVEQLYSITKNWMTKKVSDGVYAATISAIGECAEKSLDELTQRNLDRFRSFLENAQSYDNDSAVVANAFKKSLHQVRSALEGVYPRISPSDFAIISNIPKPAVVITKNRKRSNKSKKCSKPKKKLALEQ